MSRVTAQWLIENLKLEPHMEGGWFRQTFLDQPANGGRAHSTLIYYLIEGGDVSKWHRVDAAEVWHWYAGAPLRLTVSPDGLAAQSHVLGTDFLAGERPQAIVPQQHWQTARSLGDWSLVGCTVAPGFLVSKFEIADPATMPHAPAGG
ncbi:cupin domain-containing protein [Paradevosia shaoguanensis]|uniref:Cupin domain-containing protein n=1 Tax=Paradevosia shaoguanensis TaxID=1335043 RepID=A0AA41QKM6_9HYPH|nr:cupin domain-containing protein [Paradevosia shaoguanensis]MBI4046035.1 cupin domain-containing protein [Devosia nanyangense]MCF1742139.1 cupin domain-containing protein [Paradevosia shaoguanensis]MCI0126622.1 cupin domain-containing protein [Paradevosia shaoguanensis]QMV02479.1 cupin [Devosia sp. D6-9]